MTWLEITMIALAVLFWLAAGLTNALQALDGIDPLLFRLPTARGQMAAAVARSRRSVVLRLTLFGLIPQAIFLVWRLALGGQVLFLRAQILKTIARHHERIPGVIDLVIDIQDDDDSDQEEAKPPEPVLAGSK